MVRAPRARNIFPALLSIFRPLSPDILPPPCGRGNFSPTYFLVSLGSGSTEMTEPARHRKVSGGAHPGCKARGLSVRGCSVGASAAPCSADFDPPGRTAPAGRGGKQPRALCGLPAGCGAAGDHRRWGGGEAATGAEPTRIVGDSEADWVRALGEPPAWGELASRRGGSRPAPSRAQEGGREHPRRGRRPPHRPAVERARKLLSAARWTNFFWSSGASLSPHTPARTAEQGGWGKLGTVVGGTDDVESQPPPPPHQAQLPAPPPGSRSLRKLRP